MAESAHPKPVAEVMATLADICRHQRRTEVVELLENAHARFDNTEYNNWDGGTYTWALRLEVPIPLFASAEQRLARIEKELVEKVKVFNRLHPNHFIGEVSITPIAPGATISGYRLTPSEMEVRRLWPQFRFRLFLSHVSKYKVEISKLKEELDLHGVAAFVAHEAIQPSLEWQKEIELALHSMHALAALITPDFHESLWTDQEIGWAFGRGLLVLPVRLGRDPYGFAGKVQGVTGTLENPARLAALIASGLLANPQTHGEMRRALVMSFRNAISCRMALALQEHIVEQTDFTDDERAILIRACKDNKHVAEAFGVVEAIYEKFGKPANPEMVGGDRDDVPF